MTTLLAHLRRGASKVVEGFSPQRHCPPKNRRLQASLAESSQRPGRVITRLWRSCLLQAQLHGQQHELKVAAFPFPFPVKGLTGLLSQACCGVNAHDSTNHDFTFASGRMMAGKMMGKEVSGGGPALRYGVRRKVRRWAWQGSRSMLCRRPILVKGLTGLLSHAQLQLPLALHGAEFVDDTQNSGEVVSSCILMLTPIYLLIRSRRLFSWVAGGP